jgi:Mn2+/Fe2+ NRAMP family transporter
MRVVLFLGALGVVTHGGNLDPDNPPASVFRAAAGELGYRMFGVVMWAAAITSVVGSAYTSVSFLDREPGSARAPLTARSKSALIVGFIVVSTAIFLLVGRPVTVLILVGALNGLILPLGLGAMLLAATRSPYRETARTPKWLLAVGLVVTVAMAGLGGYSIVTQIPRLLRPPA